MNVTKTNVMIITDNIEDTEDYITIDNNVIRNQNKIKILGTTINSKLNWNSHLLEGQDSLLAQMKQRLNSIKIIAKYISRSFAKQMTNALLLSKLNYNIDIWGATTKHNINKIDKILESAAKIVIGKESIGRTRDWMFKKLKWLNQI